MSPETQAQLERACLSLDGLSVGDAFGEQFFVFPFGARSFTDEALIEQAIERREVPPPPWHYTDDTEMALSIVSILRQYGGISQNLLAASFGRHYDNTRGYGPAMHRLLTLLDQGLPW